MVAPPSPPRGGATLPPPPPPPAAPSARPPSSTVARPRRPWWLLGLVVVAAALVLGGVAMLVVWIGEPARTTTVSVDEHPGVTAIVLDLDDADVDVAVGGTVVEVEATIRRADTDVEPTAEVVDGVLTLGLDCGGAGGWLFGRSCDGEFRIRVPADTSLTGSTSNGSLALDGLDGDVDLATSNGRVSMTDLGGDTHVRSSNGRVTGTDLRMDRLVVESSNGAVRLDLAAAPSQVVVDTANGAIEVAVPSDEAAWNIDADTSNGGVDLGVPLDDAVDRAMELRTSNGAITVSAS